MYGSWIYNYLCNQCLSPLTLWVRIPLRRGVPVQNTLCDKVCQWLAAGMWFSPGTLVSSTNKTGRHNITEILLKVALIKHNNPTSVYLLTWFNFVLLMHINSIKSTSSGHFQSKWSFFLQLVNICLQLVVIPNSRLQERRRNIKKDLGSAKQLIGSGCHTK